MLFIRALLRRLLARHDYVLTRVEPELPPSVATYLRQIRLSAASPIEVLCFDNDAAIQTEILAVFPETQIAFSFPLLSEQPGVPALGSAFPARPASSHFIAIIDIEMFPIEPLLAKLPWLQLAHTLVLRARMGSFWSGETDLLRLASQIQAFGFNLTDAIDFPRLPHLQAPSGIVSLACDRSTASPVRTSCSRYRTLEALSFLSAPIVKRRDFQTLAGRGSFGFSAGVFNPGAITDAGHTYLLPRADRTPWALQKSDETHFFTSSQPLLLTLGDNHRITTAAELSTIGLPNAASSRTGDFRLFKFGGQILTNHFVMSYPHPHTAEHRPTRIGEMQSRVGISRLDVQRRELTWCGIPQLDRPLSFTEKNWAMFTDGECLFLLYSFSPYVLLSATNWPGLGFTTIRDERLSLPFDGDGLALRNSINPVDYDAGHWLHLVHKVYPDKQYCFWAVLIAKETLRPVRATVRPLIRGWHSCSASIIYTCSAIARKEDILLFSGLDDSATVVATISRERLDAEWVAVNRSAG